MARITIPFGVGVREDVDPAVMPDGALKRVENLRLEREGRLVLRRGSSLVANTIATGGASAFKPFDLIGYNGRLLALGGAVSSSGVPIDIYEYASGNAFNWRPTDPARGICLCPATGVRNVGRGPSQSASVTVCDVGAAGGLVCLAWELAGAVTHVHIFDPATDSTVVQNTITMTSPRVVGTSSGLYIFGIVGATVVLYRFIRASDTVVTFVREVFATGDAIDCMDASLSEDGTMACAIARSTPAVSICRLSAAGAILSTITGPTAAMLAIAVCGQAARVHLAAVESSDGHVDLYTYETSGGTLENDTFDLASSAVTDRQPGICLSGDGNGVVIMIDHAASRRIDRVKRGESSHAAIGTTQSWYEVRLASKPCATTRAEAFGGVFAESSDAETNFIGCTGEGTNLDAILGAVTDKGLAALTSDAVIPHLARDASTGKYYWARLVIDGDGRSLPQVSEVLLQDTGRRQTAIADGSLYLSGGVPQIFAGRQLVEAGYLNRPFIVSATPSNSTGTLTPGALYLVCATFEWYDEQGRFHTSEPSEVTEVTMGGSDDTITVVVTSPLSSRRAGVGIAFGGAVKIVVWRSLAAPDKQLLRDNSTTVSGDFGESETVVLTQPDSSLEDEAVIYTQGSSGARSGPNPFVSPQPCRYLYPSGDRITSGGLPKDSQIQESRAAFPNEPITWAENLGGLATAPERVLAVLRLDERRLALTANGVFEYTGEGLDINGVGDLGSPRRLPSPGGLYGGADGWRSIVETAIGIFFQLSADSIFLIPRGGGAPVFIGAPVQTTLALYPVITSATYLKTEQLVCFTCNNSGATDSVILVYDLSAQQWFVDTETSALLSSCEYQGRLVLLRADNTIEFQDTALPPSSFITPVIETGTIYPFSKGGQGQIDEIQLYAEFLGACNVVCSLSFDDGQTYDALTTKAVTSAAILPIKWGPQRMRGDRVRLKFHTTDLSGSTAQLAWQFATIDFTAHGRSALRNTTQKG